MIDGARVTASLCPGFAQARELGDLVPSDCFYSSESWFSVPHRQGRERRFAVARDETGASAAIALSPGTSARSPRYRPSSLLAGRLPDEECVLAGPLSGYRATLLRGRTPLGTAPAAQALFEASGSRVLLLPYLSSAEAAEFAAAGIPVGFVAWEGWLDVPPGGLEEFRSLLPKSRRKRVSADLRRIEGSGIRFEAGPLTEGFEQISALLAAHDRKYDGASSVPDSGFVEYLELCAKLLDAYCVKAFIDDSLVGACVLFRHADRLWVRLIGVDDSRPDTRGCYFSLGYYEPISAGRAVSVRSSRG
jgi:hypothetical protein